MKNILDPRNLEIIKKLRGRNSILIFDYDGTLAPIVSHPKKARMRASTQKLFAQLSQTHRCAIISGRTYGDLLKWTRDFNLKYRVGAHGSDWGSDCGSARKHWKIRKLVSAWKKTAEKKLSHLAGIDIEDKHFALSIHYRGAVNRRAAAAEIRALEPHFPEARAIYNKMVVDFVPLHSPNKGTAVQKILKLCKAKSALYIGDDRTDEDVFAMKKEMNIVTVHVGSSRKTQADFSLSQQSEVDRLLVLLLKSTGSVCHADDEYLRQKQQKSRLQRC